MEVGPEKVVQIITDNAPVCKAAGALIEEQFPHIFWTPCVVHILNLALKNICSAKHVEDNEITYEECHWISEVANDTVFIKNFIMNHATRLSMFNEHVKLKMLAIADTRFASVIVMLKRFKKIKQGLVSMIVCDKWSLYREDDVERARFIKEKILDDIWWDKVNYIFDFTEPIYDMLRATDIDVSCLHLIYDM
ncbi:hypothetical protein AXF42_Ash010760 [Apostasia shenzhenica]|uniref:DUF659 domain-containing protein n=1 Tax=Apostasia shenzhenica TaxID=1088818 RepID=A0A2I0A0K9_9ASPA|nr:hypothetical protein AXF42_Ash010760 [Apostasia shenzhenica]